MNPKERIVLKWYLPALDYVFCFQRKRWYGWCTVSWTYPSIFEDESMERVEIYLRWKETYRERHRERIAGERLLKQSNP